MYQNLNHFTSQTTTTETVDDNDGHNVSALPSQAVRVTRGLARRQASGTNPSLPAATEKVLQRRRQHVARKGKVKQPRRKKAMFISGKRGGFVHPSPATDKMRPRYSAGDDNRGGRAVFVFQLVFACCLHAPRLFKFKIDFCCLTQEGR